MEEGRGGFTGHHTGVVPLQPDSQFTHTSIKTVYSKMVDACILMPSNPSERINRVQNPSGMSVFRPDLNFDCASEREIEVRDYRFIK